MADVAKWMCGLDGCTWGAEVTAWWKLGRGAELPFTGGKVGANDGIHHSMQLCRAHRIEALAMPNRPYRVVMTAWAKRPGDFDLMFDNKGNLLLPGVAAAKRAVQS